MKHNVRHQFYGHIAPHTVQHCRKEFQHKLDMSARQMDLAQVAPEIRIIDNNGKQQFQSGKDISILSDWK